MGVKMALGPGVKGVKYMVMEGDLILGGELLLTVLTLYVWSA